MSLKTSQENFLQAFKEEKKTFTDKFLSELQKYLKARKDKKEYKELWGCMYRNEPLASFLCRNDICEKLAQELTHRRIPYVIVTNMNGEYGYVIRHADRGIVNDAVKSVLNRAGVCCEIVSGSELSVIDKSKKEDQQGLIAISGLTYKETRLLEQICKKKNFIDYIAVDKMSDGTYRVMVPGVQAVVDNQMALTLFELVIRSEGNNNSIYDYEIENEIKVEQLRGFDFGRRSDSFKTLYFAGDGNQFVKVEKTKFEYGTSVVIDRKKRLQTQIEMNNGTRGYSECEASCINRLRNIKVFENERQLYEYMDRNNDVNEKIMAEEAFVEAVFSVVVQNASEVDVMNIPGRWVEKTEYITYEIGRIISGLIRNSVPEGYVDLDMQEIKTMISSYDIDFNVYSKVSDIMKGLIITDEAGSLIDVDDAENRKNEV